MSEQPSTPAPAPPPGVLSPNDTAEAQNIIGSDSGAPPPPPPDPDTLEGDGKVAWVVYGGPSGSFVVGGVEYPYGALMPIRQDVLDAVRESHPEHRLADADAPAEPAAEAKAKKK